jgi:hypothetical protein
MNNKARIHFTKTPGLSLACEEHGPTTGDPALEWIEEAPEATVSALLDLLER